MTYEIAEEFLNKGRDKNSRPLPNGHHTRLERRDDGSIAVKLHDTDVVTYYPNGIIVLDSGGWKTKTTRERFNQYAPGGVYQRGGIWYMGYDDSLYYDGIKLNPGGAPVKSKRPEKHEQELKKIKKQAKAYARGFVEALQAGLVDYPSGGDCWYCALRTEDGEPLGDATNNPEHIREHIKQRYYVPSLLVNAGRAAGYRDEQIGLMGIGGQQVFIEPERVLYRYIVEKLQGNKTATSAHY